MILLAFYELFSSCPHTRILFKKSYFVGTDSINAHKWQWCTWSNFCEHWVTSEVTYLLYIFQFVDFLLASIPLTHTLTQTHTLCLFVCLYDSDVYLPLQFLPVKPSLQWQTYPSSTSSHNASLRHGLSDVQYALSVNIIRSLMIMVQMWIW